MRSSMKAPSGSPLTWATIALRSKLDEAAPVPQQIEQRDLAAPRKRGEILRQRIGDGQLPVLLEEQDGTGRELLAHGREIEKRAGVGREGSAVQVPAPRRRSPGNSAGRSRPRLTLSRWMYETRPPHAPKENQRTSATASRVTDTSSTTT